MKVKLNLRQLLIDEIGEKASVPVTVNIDELLDYARLDHESEFELDDILEETRTVAHISTIDDVRKIRPDLTDDQAWDVLNACDGYLTNIASETIATAAKKLFGEEVNRVRLFAGAVERYTDYDPQTNLIDLLADAMLWCDAKSVNFDESLQTARTHFRAETREGDRP